MFSLFFTLFGDCTENEPNREIKTKVPTVPGFLAYRYTPQCLVISVKRVYASEFLQLISP